MCWACYPLYPDYGRECTACCQTQYMPQAPHSSGLVCLECRSRGGSAGRRCTSAVRHHRSSCIWVTDVVGERSNREGTCKESGFHLQLTCFWMCVWRVCWLLSTTFEQAGLFRKHHMRNGTLVEASRRKEPPQFSRSTLVSRRDSRYINGNAVPGARVAALTTLRVRAS